jgi:hypothetical protein
MADIGEGEAAGVAEHMWVRSEIEASFSAGTLNQVRRLSSSATNIVPQLPLMGVPPSDVLI